MTDEERIHPTPLLARKELHQVMLDLLLRVMFGKTEPKRQTHHVRIRRDTLVQAECTIQHDCRSLATHSRQRRECLHGSRDSSAMFLPDLATESMDVRGLTMERTAGMNKAF